MPNPSHKFCAKCKNTGPVAKIESDDGDNGRLRCLMCGAVSPAIAEPVAAVESDAMVLMKSAPDDLRFRIPERVNTFISKVTAHTYGIEVEYTTQDLDTGEAIATLRVLNPEGSGSVSNRGGCGPDPRHKPEAETITTLQALALLRPPFNLSLSQILDLTPAQVQEMLANKKE